MTTAPVVIHDEILTESDAVARIPGRAAEVRAWLRASGIGAPHPLHPNRHLYRWSLVLALLTPAGTPAPQVATQAPTRRRVSLP